MYRLANYRRLTDHQWSMRDSQAWLWFPKQAATEAIYRHLWYLSEHLVVLALFDERVRDETKTAMVANFSRPPNQTVHRRVDKKMFSLGTPLEEYVTSKISLICCVWMDKNVPEPVSTAISVEWGCHFPTDEGCCQTNESCQRLRWTGNRFDPDLQQCSYHKWRSKTVLAETCCWSQKKSIQSQAKQHCRLCSIASQLCVHSDLNCV